ncbi:MAG: ComF family protein [Rickettsiella sp.]|nr:ComF family protein [Rickettsiella sp.]
MDIITRLKKAILGMARWFFPYTCILCSEVTKREIDLCLECEKSLPWLGHVCIHCTAPLCFESNAVCGTCLKKPFPFSKTCILFSYTEPIRKLITGIKFQRRLLYANILGNLLAEKLTLLYQNENLPEILIPVPLYKKRLHQRGFNQAMELARPIRKRLNIPIDYKSCQRIHNTAAQTTLPANQRSTNVKNAFAVLEQKNVRNKHIAILDDVMTTGHTLIEFSRPLYDAGVKKIDVWCCARTYLGSF